MNGNTVIPIDSEIGSELDAVLGMHDYPTVNTAAVKSRIFSLPGCPVGPKCAEQGEKISKNEQEEPSKEVIDKAYKNAPPN